MTSFFITVIKHFSFRSEILKKKKKQIPGFWSSLIALKKNTCWHCRGNFLLEMYFVEAIKLYERSDLSWSCRYLVWERVLSLLESLRVKRQFASWNREGFCFPKAIFHLRAVSARDSLARVEAGLPSVSASTLISWPNPQHLPSFTDKSSTSWSNTAVGFNTNFHFTCVVKACRQVIPAADIPVVAF